MTKGDLTLGEDAYNLTRARLLEDNGDVRKGRSAAGAKEEASG